MCSSTLPIILAYLVPSTVKLRHESRLRSANWKTGKGLRAIPLSEITVMHRCNHGRGTC